MTPVLSVGWRELRRAVRWHRGLVAGGLAAASVAAGLSSVAPASAETVTVVAAARDIPAGVALAADDLALLALPPASVPAGALRQVDELVGRVVPGPVRSGEPITDVRVLGPRLLAAWTGRPEVVAAPIRLADPDTAALLRVGDVVDVLAAASQPGAAPGPGAVVVAAGVPVLAVPVPADSTSTAEGALIVLATSPATAARLAAAAVSSRLSVSLRTP